MWAPLRQFTRAAARRPSDGEPMTQPPSPQRAGCAAGAALLAALCLLASHPVAAQPGYRPAPAAYGQALRDYPAPPRGFRGGRPYECGLYARDEAEWYAPRGAGVAGGAVRGAVGGAVFGAIVGAARARVAVPLPVAGWARSPRARARGRSATSRTSSPTTTACWAFAAEGGSQAGPPTHLNPSQEPPR